MDTAGIHPKPPGAVIVGIGAANSVKDFTIGILRRLQDCKR